MAVVHLVTMQRPALDKKEYRLIQVRSCCTASLLCALWRHARAAPSFTPTESLHADRMKLLLCMLLSWMACVFCARFRSGYGCLQSPLLRVHHAGHCDDEFTLHMSAAVCCASSNC